MNIAFFVAEPTRFNGSQKSLLALVKQLQDSNIKLQVIFPENGLCVQRYREAGISTYILPQPKALKKGGKSLFNAGILTKLKLFIFGTIVFSWQLNRYLQKNKFTHLHCNTTKAMLMAFFWPMLANKPIIWHVRGRIDDLPKRERALCGLVATKIILVANALISGIPKAYQQKTITIYNGINAGSFTYNQEKNNWLTDNEIPDKNFVIAHFAALEPFKGQHHLIEAAKILANEQLNPTILLIGQHFDEEYVAYLNNKISEYNLTNTHLVGWQNQVLDFYQRADLVVLPTIEREIFELNHKKHHLSATEGLPRTIVEAMFLGKRVIASIVAGTPEQIIDQETGYLIPPSNPEMLAYAIKKMMQMTPEARVEMEIKAKNKALQQFDIVQVAKQMISIYEQC